MKPISLSQSFLLTNKMTENERYILSESRIVKELYKTPYSASVEKRFSICQNFILDLSYYFCEHETEKSFKPYTGYIDRVLSYENVSYQIDIIIRKVFDISNGEHIEEKWKQSNFQVIGNILVCVEQFDNSFYYK